MNRLWHVAAVSVIAASLLAPSASRAAWSGIETGSVGTVHVAPADNYAVRVHLEDGRVMCAALPDRPEVANWGFLNENDSNYKVFVATLMLAKATGGKVTIYTTAEPYGQKGTMCRIGYVVLY